MCSKRYASFFQFAFSIIGPDVRIAVDIVDKGVRQPDSCFDFLLADIRLYVNVLAEHQTIRSGKLYIERIGARLCHAIAGTAVHVVIAGLCIFPINLCHGSGPGLILIYTRMHDHLASFGNRTVAHILFIDLAFYTEISRCKNGQEGIVGVVTGVSAGAAVIVVD